MLCKSIYEISQDTCIILDLSEWSWHSKILSHSPKLVEVCINWHEYLYNYKIDSKKPVFIKPSVSLRTCFYDYEPIISYYIDWMDYCLLNLDYHLRLVMCDYEPFINFSIDWVDLLMAIALTMFIPIASSVK